MFIRVKDRRTGHEFDIHEEQFDDAKHAHVKRYPPSNRIRRTKFRVRLPRALSISPEGEEGAAHVATERS